MNNTALDKIIKKIIIPKYPWIKDYSISEDSVGGSTLRRTYYRVDYFIDPRYDGKDLRKVEEVTRMLFNALGYNEYHKFDGVNFYLSKQS
jgi:hypothetical protein